ncbi:glycosyltransferase [Photobacterium carnosum]|uniref:glycosyltransferase n=1 Tax=Photobacterium carnosum TaxID=2023717 RepID=UPI001E2B883C|nr:glycosyltransferase [Photobacterium carnosum]MCD9497743.1 glycosyltransferase [Photobacterium carnosum]
MKNKITIGYLGSLTKVKGFFRLIDFIYDFNSIDFYFKFAGKGDLSSIKNKLSENILYEGILKQDEVNNFIDSCDMFILLSECEHFSLAILEILARGKIVVVNDIPVMHEIITNKKNGIMISEIEELDEIIIDVANGKYNHIKENAYITAHKFDFECTKKRTIELYENILRSN